MPWLKKAIRLITCDNGYICAMLAKAVALLWLPEAGGRGLRMEVGKGQERGEAWPWPG